MARTRLKWSNTRFAPGREFRDQVEDYFNICDEWADEELAGNATQIAEAVKKGGQTNFESEIRQQIERLIGPGSAREMDFEALETAARSGALQLGRPSLGAPL